MTLTTEKQVAAHTILEQSVCLMLQCRFMGNTRSIRMADVDLKDKATGADIEDKDQLGLTKQLLDRALLRPVYALFFSAKAYLRGTSTAAHRVFGSGTYLVPVGMVEEVDARLEQFAKDVAAAVEKVVAEYPEAIARAKESLGPLFRASDYLSVEDVRASFGMEWSYVSFESPDRLKSVSAVLAAKGEAKYQARLASAYEEVVLDLRSSALAIVTDVAERLTPGPDGKLKALRGTALDDLQSFLARLPKRNIAGDDALTKALTNVSAFSEGLDTEALKKMPKLREQMAAAAAEAAEALATLVETAPRRAISFGGAQ